MTEYNKQYCHFTNKNNYHAYKAKIIADRLNNNSYVKENNGYDIRPKYKPKYPKLV